MASRSEKFTEHSRRVLNLAKDEAQRFNHNYIGTEHILLGLIQETDGAAGKALLNLDVELRKVRSKVEFIVGRGERSTSDKIGLTPRTKKVIELAVDEARRHGHNYIGTEHLLIGLMREGGGVAAGVLESIGINLSEIIRSCRDIRTLTPAGYDIPRLREGILQLTPSKFQELVREYLNAKVSPDAEIEIVIRMKM